MGGAQLYTSYISSATSQQLLKNITNNSHIGCLQTINLTNNSTDVKLHNAGFCEDTISRFKVNLILTALCYIRNVMLSLFAK